MVNMDETQKSRTSDAAATRKRRSSILKSQRAPRTPFSELGFNVATPTDTAKSRRVSFSRRTGVAEFITNEATTTWKNFYEEQNRSLESSGNDTNALRQPIGHIGKGIFDQQFEDAEVIHFTGALNNPTGLNINTSLNNVNFTQQFASLECTGDDRKLTAPQTNFEFSTFTDHHSKLFGDDLAVPSTGEMSGRIDVNFSAVQPLGEGEDDLDEIQRDLQKVQSNGFCQGPFSDRNMSEYIEIDLNMTHATMRCTESDMSITDTVHSPKVQDLSKSCSLDKKLSLSKDCVMDKENIVINPYVAPRESDNFAINEESDKILVFDGKRLTIQSERDSAKNNYRQTLLPDVPVVQTPQRKTIVLDINDDLPNFIDDLHICKSETSYSKDDKQNASRSAEDLPESQPKLNAITQKRRTILYNDDMGNISMTQAVPTNIIVPEKSDKSDKGRTIIYDNDSLNISITQALPANIIHTEKVEKRRTILYENDAGNISVTQAIPSNILLLGHTQVNPDKRRTILFENDAGDISMTQGLPVNIVADKISEKRRTIVFEDDTGNISVTQALPGNIVQDVTKKRSTIVYENETANISITQAVPANILENAANLGQIRTVVFENDTMNMSVTQAIPTNIILPEDELLTERRRTILYENDTGDVSVTEAIPTNIISSQKSLTDKMSFNKPRNDTMAQFVSTNMLETENTHIPNRTRTVVYEDDTGNMSVTQVVPASNVNLANVKVDTLLLNESICTENKSNDKRKQIEFDDDPAGIAMTTAIPCDTILPEIYETNRQTIVVEEIADVSMTEDISNNCLEKCQVVANAKTNCGQDLFMAESNKDTFDETKRKTTLCQDGDISVTYVVPHRINLEDSKRQILVDAKHTDMTNTMSISQTAREEETEKRKTIVFEKDLDDFSITRPVPAEFLSMHSQISDKSQLSEHNLYKTNLISNLSQEIVVYQSVTTHSAPNVPAKRTEQGDSKSEKTIASNDKINASGSKIIEDVAENITPQSSIKKCTNEILLASKNETKEINNLQDEPNISMTVFECESKIQNLEVYNEEQQKKSILIDLLDMSKASMESGIDDKNVMANIESEKPSIENINTDKPAIEQKSSEGFFYITNDSDDEAQTEICNENIELSGEDLRKSIMTAEESPRIESHSPIPLEYTQENPEIVSNLQKKLVELKSCVIEDEKISPTNSYCAKIINKDLGNIVEKEEDKSYGQCLNTSKGNKSFKTADDTNELLQLLSDFTDKGVSKYIEEEEEEEKKLQPVVFKGHIALENKREVNDTRRLSFVPRRQSIVLSREDLLNNISMAQATLRQSKFELDDSESLEDTERETPIEQKSPRRMSVRMSTEVVKTLHFEEDDTISETSVTSNPKVSPLKKTAFGETSYMQESKSKVIPSYLKDVSDGLKALMSDLVKPAAETVPYEAGLDCARKIPSTCSLQIQANLITSSQIDISTELYSNPESVVNIRNSLAAEISGLGNRAVARALENPIKAVSTSGSEKSTEMEVDCESAVGTDSFKEYVIQARPIRNQIETVPGRVIMFDHGNPLNNVLLAPIDYSEVHKYNPTGSTDTLCASERSHSAQILLSEKDREYEVDRVSVQYNVQGPLLHSGQPSGDAGSENVADTPSITSNISKPMSIDQSIDAKVMDVKDIEVNTLIAMKENKELLEASSSLTLVDEALGDNAFDVEINTRTTASQEADLSSSKKIASPVKVIFKTEGNGAIKSEKVDSDLTSNKEELEPADKQCKPKKRIYSPNTRDRHKHCTLSSLDSTPKPTSKMQKLSNSPNIVHDVLAAAPSPEKLAAEKDENTDSKPEIDVQEAKDEKLSNSSIKKSKGRKPSTTVTVQQLITEYQMQTDIDQNKLNKQILDALSDPHSDSSNIEPKTASQSDVKENGSLGTVSSFTSSNNLNEARENRSHLGSMSSVRSKGSRMDWHPELINELSSKNLVSECESDVNVVAKLDMLPFMGSQECEWGESCADSWAFRLLHARLRLVVRLAHRHGNATRSRVRADTPVLHLALEITHHDEKNTVATVCVRFAAEAMRYVVGRGCTRAGEVPALVRRCCGVARVALRWGRALHDARARLACTLTDDGELALKVANIPLRSVWEVRMRLEMVVGEEREVPWPRAGGVRVASVVSDCRVTEAEVRRVLAHVPQDWGHVPRTLWRIFKHLKHKTRDDELLGI